MWISMVYIGAALLYAPALYCDTPCLSRCQLACALSTLIIYQLQVRASWAWLITHTRTGSYSPRLLPGGCPGPPLKFQEGTQIYFFQCVQWRGSGMFLLLFLNGKVLTVGHLPNSESELRHDFFSKNKTFNCSWNSKSFMKRFQIVAWIQWRCRSF